MRATGLAAVLASVGLHVQGSRDLCDRFENPCAPSVPEWVADKECPFTGSAPGYTVECYRFNVPLNWTENREAQCNRTTPVYIQRIYHQGLDPSKARGHLVMGNPGGPGGAVFGFQMKQTWLGFHNLTNNKYVYYVQQVRGVEGNGSVTCAGKTPYVSGLRKVDAKSEKCLSDILDNFGRDLRFYGYGQLTYDLRYTLSVIRNLRKRQSAKITVYGLSGGTKMMQNYWAMFPKRRDQFDQHILDGVVTPGPSPLFRTYNEATEHTINQIFTTCLFREECWEHFRGLTYHKRLRNGTFSEHPSPVISVAGLYHHMIDVLLYDHAGSAPSKCMTKLEALAKKSGSNILASSFVDIITLTMSTWSNDVSKRPLYPVLVRMLRDCEFENSDDAEKLFYLYTQMTITVDGLSMLTPTQLGSNALLSASQMLNEYMLARNVQHDVRDISIEDLDSVYYDTSFIWGLIRLAKRLLKYRYTFDVELARTGRTRTPLMVIEGDYDPRTPSYANNDYFGKTWIGNTKSQYSYKLPFGRHALIFSSPTTYDKNVECGMQLIAAFVKRNGKLRRRDTLCVFRPVFPDFGLVDNSTLEMAALTFNSSYSWPPVST
mmetsp:Transcript_12329/g.26423  ORF Transcript_12329/g.26423 Transcript_12329/m.26423 type:complete len:602 (-) Transcript_12329:429-2234(-)